jgi:hypothetical protein
MGMKGQKMSGLKKALGIGAFALASFLPMKAQLPDHPINYFISLDEAGKAYNALTTEEQRENNYLQGKLNADWGNTIPYDLHIWNCDHYSKLLETNSHDWGDGIRVENPFGPSELLYNGNYSKELSDVYANGGTLADMGTIAAPVYTVSIDNYGDGHGMNAILTGNDAFDWYSWDFIEPQTDNQNVQPGEILMPMNGKLSIGYTYKINGNQLKDLAILRFNIQNGIPSLEYVNPVVNLIRYRESDAPDINRTSPLEGMLYSSVPYIYNIDEANFKSAKYSVDNGVTWIDSPQEMNATLNNLPEGDNKLITKSDDWFLLESEDVVNFSVDKTPPTADILSPEQGDLTNEDIKLKYNFSDQHLDLENSYYKLNEVKGYFSSASGEIALNSPEGDNKLEVIVMDKAGNKTSKNINYEIDKTSPKIIVYSPKPDSTYTQNNVNLEGKITDENLSSNNNYYEFNGMQNYFSQPEFSSPLNSTNGENNLKIHAEDNAGNVSDTSFSYNYSPINGIEDIAKDKFKAYPNPAKEIVRFEFVNTFGEDMDIEMYNSAGQLIGGKKTNKDKFDYDISNYARGFYLYRILDESGKTIDSGKILKKL